MDSRIAHFTTDVRYAETDASGYVNIINYFTWLDSARDKFFIQLDTPYKEFEDNGIMLMLVGYSLEFKNPVRYGDLVQVLSAITEISAKRLTITHFVYKQDTKGEDPLCVCVAEARMAFVDSSTYKSTDFEKSKPDFYKRLRAFLMEGDWLEDSLLMS